MNKTRFRFGHHGPAALAAAALLGVTSRAAALGNPGDLILNEFNAVSDTEFLEEDTPGDNNADAFFGRVLGNGGNWCELVVVKDHLDIRGWKIEWDNADPDAGMLTFTSDPLWANLRAGTIITLREADANYGPLPTNVSFNPAANDWWIHIDIDSVQYIVQTNGFKVDNDNWRMRIVDESNNVVQGYVGEGQALWAGSGINNQEMGKLEQNPSAAAAISPPVPQYQDGNTSTFAAPNRWNNGASFQNFAALRGWIPAVPALPVLPAAAFVTSLLTLGGLALRRSRRR